MQTMKCVRDADGQIKLPRGYRWLRFGTTLRDGDKWHEDGGWFPTGRAGARMAERRFYIRRIGT